MFNANAINTIDQSTVENEGARYPTITFVNGDPKMKKSGGVAYEGGWFIDLDKAPEDMTKFGWIKDSFMSRAGDEIEGYWSPRIEISVINQRRRWMVDGQGFPWNAYEDAKAAGNPRGHQQFLVLVKGAEALGPFAITLKGHVGMAFDGARQYAQTGVKSTFSKTVLAAANAVSKKMGSNNKWPYRAFWMTVGAQKDAKGQPMFTPVGTGSNVSTVILPVPVGLPEKAAQVDLNKYYVGDDILAIVNQLFDDSRDWVAQWESKTSSDVSHRNGAHQEEGAEISADAIDELGV